MNGCPLPEAPAGARKGGRFQLRWEGSCPTLRAVTNLSSIVAACDGLRTGGRWFLHASVDRGPSAFHRTTAAAGLRVSGAFLPACAQATGWFWNRQTSRSFVIGFLISRRSSLVESRFGSRCYLATSGWASLARTRLCGSSASTRRRPPRRESRFHDHLLLPVRTAAGSYRLYGLGSYSCSGSVKDRCFASRCLALRVADGCSIAKALLGVNSNCDIFLRYCIRRMANYME